MLEQNNDGEISNEKRSFIAGSIRRLKTFTVLEALQFKNFENEKLNTLVTPTRNIGYKAQRKDPIKQVLFGRFLKTSNDVLTFGITCTNMCRGLCKKPQVVLAHIRISVHYFVMCLLREES